jgi:hypothetical protein
MCQAISQHTNITHTHSPFEIIMPLLWSCDYIFWLFGCLRAPLDSFHIVHGTGNSVMRHPSPKPSASQCASVPPIARLPRRIRAIQVSGHASHSEFISKRVWLCRGSSFLLNLSVQCWWNTCVCVHICGCMGAMDAWMHGCTRDPPCGRWGQWTRGTTLRQKGFQQPSSHCGIPRCRGCYCGGEQSAAADIRGPQGYSGGRQHGVPGHVYPAIHTDESGRHGTFFYWVVVAKLFGLAK